MSKLTYESAKALYWPYDVQQMQHLCALRDLKIEELRDENAKLRELALMMFGCAKASECDECKELNDGYACAYIMRELGIEVQE